jgi:hypothetical protein
MSSAPINVDQAAFQKRIDAVTGTKDGRPLIKLAWAPDELRWMPHALGTDPIGYTFPIFCNGRNPDGSFNVPELWVLLERLEPQQFAPLWEAGRYVNHQGTMYDLRGPCPNEKYVELRCHSYHDGVCCPCLGDSCKCNETFHCWGKYAAPDEHLLEWIRWVAYESRQDRDVNPAQDIREFESTHAQQELKGRILAEQEKRDEVTDLDKSIVDYWVKQPHSVGAQLEQQRNLTE